MEELATKIAELLDVTVETAIELYPVLREQYIVYRITSLISSVVFFTTFVILAFYVIGVFDIYEKEDDSYISIMNDNYSELREARKKENELIIKGNKIRMSSYLKKSWYFVIPILVMIIIEVIKFVYATDLIMLKDLL